jgi:hypothetical protein
MQTVQAVRKLIDAADAILDKPIDVVTEKAYTPPTGDKRTYVSLATYCWPANPDHLLHPVGPWECTDGHAFPGVRLSFRWFVVQTAPHPAHLCDIR